MFNTATLRAFISRRLYLLPVALAINLISAAVVAALPGVTLTVTKTAALLVDVNSNGKANPGDTLRYTVVVRNSGIVTATNIAIADTLDSNTALVPNSVKVWPVAVSDDYIATGNISITVPAGSGVLLNDFGLPAPGVVMSSGVSAQGGQYSVNADGSFTYDPPAGYEGTDTFNYTLANSAGSDSATVRVAVSGMIWFINNAASACSSACDGRLSHPFRTVGDFTAVNNGTGNHPAANDNIFVYESAAAYTGTLSLLNSQRLIGQDATSSLQTLSGLTPPVNSLPATYSGNGTFAALSGGIVLAQYNRLYGFTASNGGGSAISGTNFITLTVRDVGITTTNAGLVLNNGTADAIFVAVTSSAGTNNVSLTSLGGSLNMGSGALSGAGGDAFVVNGGTATITYTGSINNTTARPVNITNKTGGIVSFGGAVTGSSNGINLTSNTGATINFNAGGMNLNTGANIAFNATGGGTVNVSGANNTLATTSATALFVQNTNIGSSGLTFRSIASTAPGSNRGIVLDTTGATAGLTVTGNGAAGTGGTIANKTGGDGSTANGIGIYLNNTRSVSLAWMQLNDCQNYAIRGFNVVNFILDHSVINGVNGTNDGFDEDSVAFDGLTGVAVISNDNISGGYEDNFRVRNTTGTLNGITISNTTFGANSSALGDDSLFIEASGVGTVINVTVLDSFFTAARGDLIQLSMVNGATMGLVFTGNTLSNNHANIVSGGGGATFSGNGIFTYNISNNTFRNALGIELNVASMGSAAVFSGRIENNTIGVSGVINSGSTQASGIAIQSQGGGDHTVLVNNNTIQQYNSSGILILNGDMMGNAVVLNATVTNNTVRQPGGFAVNGIHLNNGSVTADNFTACVDIRSNTLAGSSANGGTDFRLRQRQATTVRLPSYGGANNDNTAVVTFVQGGNTGNETGSAANTVATGGGFTGGGACAQPAPLAILQATGTEPAAAIEQMDIADQRDSSEFMEVPLVNARAPSPQQPARMVLSGETINLGLFNLPPNKTITITFDAQIANPTPSGIIKVSNQAQVSGASFSSVVSDDPNTLGLNDPTITALDVYSLTTHLAGAGIGSVDSAPAGIACGMDSITCTAYFEGGTVVTLTAAPSITSTFKGWDGACVNSSGICVVTMTQTQSVTATFGIITELTTHLAGAGIGSVDSAPAGIACGMDSISCTAYFEGGTVVTLTAAPSITSTFQGWDGACVNSSGICVVTMTQTQSVTATFGIITELTTHLAGAGIGRVDSTPAGIACGMDSITCTAYFEGGTVVTLTAAPSITSTFQGWDGACVNSTGICVVTMTQTQSVTATFGIITELTTHLAGAGIGSVDSAPAGIACGMDSITCTAYFEGGTVVTLTAAPSITSTFQGWDGACVNSSGICVVTMTQTQSVTATFGIITELTTHLAGAGIGSVDSAPAGIACGMDSITCTAYFEGGTVVTLTAAPSITSTFQGWDGACVNSSGICVVTMTQTQSVTATFGIITELTTHLAGAGIGSVDSAPAGIACGMDSITCTAYFEGGTVVTLTAAPSITSTFQGWDGACVNSTGICVVTMTQTQSVTATFGIITELTTHLAGAGIGSVDSAPAGIACGMDSITCTAYFEGGTVVTLTAAPSITSTFQGWDGACVNSSGICVVSMTQTQSVTATFGIITELTTHLAGAGIGSVDSAPAGIACGMDSITCTAYFEGGTVVTLTAAPSITSTFQGWDGACVNSSGICVVTMTQTQSVTATFGIITELTTHLAGAGIGSVDSAPAGIACGMDSITCTAYFEGGTVVTLTAAPSITSTFQGWDGACVNSSGICVVTMTQTQSVTATFGIITELTTHLAGAGIGSVDSAPAGIACGMDSITCTAYFEGGTVVTLTAAPSITSTFKGWDGACVNSSGICVVTMTQTQSVTATFGIITELTTHLAGAGIGSVDSAPAGIACGMDSITCTAYFEGGTVVTLTAAPSITSTFKGWDGACVNSSGICVVTMTQTQSVTATFGIITELTTHLAGAGIGSVDSAPAGIACGMDSITCTAYFEGGTVVTLTAAPSITSTFQGWDGACVNSSGICVVTMTQTQSVTATFGIITATDLSISESVVSIGNDITFTVVVSNSGPADASGAIISGSLSSNAISVTWSCVGANGATCNPSGTGYVISETLPYFPAGGVVTFTITGSLETWISRVSSSMEVIPPTGINEPNMDNNSASGLSGRRLLIINVRNGG